MGLSAGLDWVGTSAFAATGGGPDFVRAKSETASAPDAIIDRARQRMAANVAGLPNFTCTETTARTVRRASTQRLLFRDTIHLEVAFISGTEMFSWPGSGSFEPGFLQNLPHSGVSGTGG